MHQLLPQAADVIRRRPVAALGGEALGRDDIAPRQLAVEADPHEAAGPHQRKQDRASLPSDRRDGAARRSRRPGRSCGRATASLQDVGLARIRYWRGRSRVSCDAHSSGLPELRSTASTRASRRLRATPMEFCPVPQPAISTSRPACGRVGADRRCRKFLTHVLVQALRLDAGGRDHPARIGIFLVLLADLARRVVLDRGEPGDGVAVVPLAFDLTDLLRHQRGDAARASFAGIALADRQRACSGA